MRSQVSCSPCSSNSRLYCADCKANKLVCSIITFPDQPLEIVTSLLDILSRGQAAKRTIEKEDTFGQSAFGDDWQGVRSKSEPLLALVEWMRSLKGLGAEPRLIVSRGPEKGDISTRAEILSSQYTPATRLLREVWQDINEISPVIFSGVASGEKVNLEKILNFATKYTEVRLKANAVLVTPAVTVNDYCELLDRLVYGIAARNTIREQEALGQAAFDNAWRAEQSDWLTLADAAQWIAANKDIRALAGRVGERESLRPLIDQLSSAQTYIVSQFGKISSELKLDLLASIGAPIPEALLQVINWRLHRWVDEYEQLFRWVTFRDRADKAISQGCGDLVVRLGDGRLDCEHIVRAFEMAYFDVVYSQMVRAQPELGRFDGVLHSRRVNNFAMLDRQRIAAARLEVARAHHQLVPPRDGGSVGPLGVLRGEIQKKKGHISLRKLVERAGPALTALKPVFMMSPLSVAQFLVPGGLEFDLLVMDEASQIQPVDALGAVARVKQVVVVGDQKQLPPSSFFAKMTTSGSSEYEEDDVAQVADIESILGLFIARGLPMRMLRWHYRSRHQSLIAVSNRQFYENKLFIVPSPYTSEGTRGLHFQYIQDGLFDAGNKRNNAAEAKVVAKAIIEHARLYPKKTLGVAAFSVSKRRAIIDELELLRRNLPVEIESFFTDHRSEPFFVKNLENVQGDERDVIFISVGYGRSIPGGKIPMRFGPLGTEGGERRLNVLISRAKERCDVFASMTDEDIDPTYAAGKKGVFAFRLFLQYARTGKLPMAEITGRDYDSIFEEQVAYTLRTRGYNVQAQIGIAGFFIDLAIIDEVRPGRFLSGIECDGAAYHSAKSARDRDRLRQAVLEDHGWKIHRIWSTDWYQRPIEQLDIIIKKIELIRAEFNEQKEEIILTQELDSATPYIEREDPVEYVDTGFALYKEVVLARPTHRNDELHDTPQGILTDMVVHTVTVEGPVHRDQVIMRIRDAWGLKRAGARIEVTVGKSIEIAERLNRISRKGDFLFLPEAAIVPRDRSEVVAISLKKPEMLPPQEIEAAMLFLLRSNFGATREQIIPAVARALGIRTTSSQLRGVIDNILGGAVTSGILTEVMGMLTVAEESLN